MCFAPQRRALFRHLNFQKWSDNGVFCTVWLQNVLRVTTACKFSSLIWPAGSAPAALASLLFDPPEPQIIGKTQCFATYLFAHLHLLSSDSFSSDLLSSNLSLLSASALLCFSSVHIVGSLTSKLPSIICYNITMGNSQMVGNKSHTHTHICIMARLSLDPSHTLSITPTFQIPCNCANSSQREPRLCLNLVPGSLFCH